MEERPTHINNRSEVGHYEIDTVILSKTKGQCLLTLTERKYRAEIIILLPDKTSKSINDVLLTLSKSTVLNRSLQIMEKNLLGYLRQSPAPGITVMLMRVVKEEQMKIIYKMIRKFLPKGTKKTTHQVVAFIEQWVNNYPRRMFNYKSSIQMNADG